MAETKNNQTENNQTENKGTRRNNSGYSENKAVLTAYRKARQKEGRSVTSLRSLRRAWSRRRSRNMLFPDNRESIRWKIIWLGRKSREWN
ncbi:MAG: hypothetical protein LUG99_10480 [Lachnospiraceae bacterium]|nr:hypothetical protein [Lachnospiraceae bacterium]